MSSRTIYKKLKNIVLTYPTVRRFALKRPNDMVQMDIMGPFYIHQSSARNYIIICIDDSSRKVASKCSERKSSIDVLSVMESPRKSCMTMAYNKKREHGGINEHHLKCFYKHSIDRITEITPNRKVSLM